MASNPTPSASDSETPIAPWLPDALKFIFSWIVLMPVAVIVSGKLLSQRFNVNSSDGDLFKIPIPGLFIIGAKNSEVVLGFTGFLATLFLLSAVAGHVIYRLFKYQFGVDPGQFDSLCIFSSFATVLWTAALFVLTAGKSSPLQAVHQEHERLIQSIAEANKPR